ncbi:MAG: MM0924 family protein [Blastocatellia bacterium]
MRNFLESRLGKEIEVQCEGTMIKGKVAKIEGSVLYLTKDKDEDACYVNIDKILVVWDSREKKAQPPGFSPKSK